MKITHAGIVWGMLLPFTLACGQQKSSQPAQQPASQGSTLASENYPNLAVQAKEVVDSFARKDFAKVAELTYSKVVEAAGGRDRLSSFLTQGVKAQEAEGVSLVSSTAGNATQIIRVSGALYAVIPTTQKVNVKSEGLYHSEGFLIGISADDGRTWTFIDASGKENSDLMSVLPEAAEKLVLPKEKPPTPIPDDK